MSLNRNTQKTSYVLIGLWKCDQRLTGNQSCIFPTCSDSVLANSMFLGTLQNVTTASNKNWLYCISIKKNFWSGLSAVILWADLQFAKHCLTWIISLKVYHQVKLCLPETNCSCIFFSLRDLYLATLYFLPCLPGNLRQVLQQQY